VIRGGKLGRPLPEERFVDAYATNTRLMGVLVVYIHWRLSGAFAKDGKSRSLRQFFYIETTEEGIESYRAILGDNEEELREAEQLMLGGLGAQKVLLTMNEAVWLVQEYAKMNKKFGTPLPDDVKGYAFVLERETNLDAAREKALFARLCGKITNDNHLINSFLMRYFAGDFYPVDMLASQPISHELTPELFCATLCLNEIRSQTKSKNSTTYFCESVVDDDDGHRIIASEITLTGNAGERTVADFHITANFAITDTEAAMKLSRPEYVTVYEIAGPVKNVIEELDERYRGALQNMTEGGKLYVSFMDDNRHINLPTFRINDDVKEILYVTVEDQLVVGAYTLAGVKRLENKLLLSPIRNQLIEVAKYEFKESILYDYTTSEGSDFVAYIQDVMGVEDDDE